MDITSLLKKLDISTLGIVWAKLTGGWKGVAVYLCKALTALLKKLPAEELKRYAGVIRKVMELVKMIVTDFVPVAYKDAGMKTVEAIEDLSEHVEDGEYTEEELDKDIDNVQACVEAWKNVKKAA